MAAGFLLSILRNASDAEHARIFVPPVPSAPFMLKVTKITESYKEDCKMSNTIDRREFLKRLGIGGSIAGLALTGCRNAEKAVVAAEPGKEGEMTTRKNPKTGDNVSILGYGCMRWPTKPVEGGEEGEEEIDQEMVNRLVDTALEHGVNYFDTSPAYCRGKSEGATGIALSRHPRDGYYIATKLSNFAPQTFSREASIGMYRNSLKELKTDYIDYLLLHGVGMGGMDNLHARYLDNGVLEFLLKEREEGRIRNSDFPTMET